MMQVLIFALIVSAFTACSGVKKSGKEGENQQQPVSSQKPAENITITFQHIGGTIPEQVKVLNEMAQKFSEQNPDVTVEVVNVGWGEAYSLFQRQVTVGQAPDLVMLTAQWSNEYQRLGAFAPIDDYVSKDVLDQFLESGFVKGEDGKIYGVPWDGSIWSFFYRKDLFEKAGLDPNKPPTTWDELVQYAKVLTKGDQFGLVFPAGSWEGDDYFLPFLWQAGNNVVKKDGDKWAADIDNDAGLKAAKFVYDLSNKYKVVPQTIIGMDWEATMNTFISGKAAMMFNGMWVANNLKGNANLNGKWATAASPAGPAGQAVLGYPNTLHITQQSKHKEIVGKFLEFIFSGNNPTYYDKYCQVTGVLPWTKDYANSDFAKDPIMKPFVDQIPFAKNRPIIPKYEEFRQLYFNPGIQELIQGKIKPEDFVRIMNDDFNKLLQQQ